MSLLYLNTSNVTVNLTGLRLATISDINLNTSNVTVNLVKRQILLIGLSI